MLLFVPDRSIDWMLLHINFLLRYYRSWNVTFLVCFCLWTLLKLLYAECICADALNIVDFTSTAVFPPGIKEAVVCEGKKSTISCSTGHVIKVVQANYGRYSLSRCPSKHIKTTNCFNIRWALLQLSDLMLIPYSPWFIASLERNVALLQMISVTNSLLDWVNCVYFWSNDWFTI